MDSDREKDRRKWHIRKELNVSDVATLVIAIISVVSSYVLLTNRLSVVETALAAHKEEDVRSDVRVTRALDRMSDNIDRLLEREAARDARKSGR